MGTTGAAGKDREGAVAGDVAAGGADVESVAMTSATIATRTAAATAAARSRARGGMATRVGVRLPTAKGVPFTGSGIET